MGGEEETTKSQEFLERFCESPEAFYRFVSAKHSILDAALVCNNPRGAHDLLSHLAFDTCRSPVYVLEYTQSKEAERLVSLQERIANSYLVKIMGSLLCGSGLAEASLHRLCLKSFYTVGEGMAENRAREKVTEVLDFSIAACLAARGLGNTEKMDVCSFLPREDVREVVDRAERADLLSKECFENGWTRSVSVMEAARIIMSSDDLEKAIISWAQENIFSFNFLNHVHHHLTRFLNFSQKRFQKVCSHGAIDQAVIRSDGEIHYFANFKVAAVLTFNQSDLVRNFIHTKNSNFRMVDNWRGISAANGTNVCNCDTSTFHFVRF